MKCHSTARLPRIASLWCEFSAVVISTLKLTSDPCYAQLIHHKNKRWVIVNIIVQRAKAAA